MKIKVEVITSYTDDIPHGSELIVEQSEVTIMRTPEIIRTKDSNVFEYSGKDEYKLFTNGRIFEITRHQYLVLEERLYIADMTKYE